MQDDNEKNFLEALAVFDQPMASTVESSINDSNLLPPDVFYRLYYDDQSMPLFYSMEDLPGNYIDIDCDTYHNPPTHLRIVDGKIQVTKTSWISRLYPDKDAGTPCDPDDVSIVVLEQEPHQKWSL